MFPGRHHPYCSRHYPKIPKSEKIQLGFLSQKWKLLPWKTASLPRTSSSSHRRMSRPLRNSRARQQCPTRLRHARQQMEMVSHPLWPSAMSLWLMRRNSPFMMTNVKHLSDSPEERARSPSPHLPSSLCPSSIWRRGKKGMTAQQGKELGFWLKSFWRGQKMVSSYKSPSIYKQTRSSTASNSKFQFLKSWPTISRFSVNGKGRRSTVAI